MFNVFELGTINCFIKISFKIIKFRRFESPHISKASVFLIIVPRFSKQNDNLATTLYCRDMELYHDS